MKLIIIFLSIIVLPLQLVCMSEQEIKHLEIEWRYTDVVDTEIRNKQQLLIWGGGAGFCYSLIRSAQAKRGTLAGLSITTMSTAGFAYLEHEARINNTARNHIIKRYQQLTDK